MLRVVVSYRCNDRFLITRVLNEACTSCAKRAVVPSDSLVFTSKLVAYCERKKQGVKLKARLKTIIRAPDEEFLESDLVYFAVCSLVWVSFL